MSLLSWVTHSDAKKRKINDVASKSDRDKIYDRSKRERKYNVSWPREFPWLVTEGEQNVMFCKICRNYKSLAGLNSSFVCGTTSFHKATLQSHDTSLKHRQCIIQAKHDTQCDEDAKATAISLSDMPPDPPSLLGPERHSPGLGK